MEIFELNFFATQARQINRCEAQIYTHFKLFAYIFWHILFVIEYRFRNKQIPLK